MTTHGQGRCCLRACVRRLRAISPQGLHQSAYACRAARTCWTLCGLLKGGVAIDIASLSSRELAGTCRVRSHMPLGHKRLELQVEARAGGDPRNGPETAAESHVVQGWEEHSWSTWKSMTRS